MNKILKNMQKYDNIKPNHKMSFMVLYHSSNKAISHLEQLIINDYKKYNFPQSKLKRYLKNIKKKNIQMVAKFKSTNN